MLSTALRMIIIGATVSVFIVSWPFVFAIIPLAAAFWKLQGYFIPTTRELRRLSSLANSPIYSHFGETLNGISIIQAFHKSKDFGVQNKDLVDADNQTYYPSIMANRWLSLRLESIANVAMYVYPLNCPFILYQFIQSPTISDELLTCLWNTAVSVPFLWF